MLEQNNRLTVDLQNIDVGGLPQQEKRLQEGVQLNETQEQPVNAQLTLDGDDLHEVQLHADMRFTDIDNASFISGDGIGEEKEPSYEEPHQESANEQQTEPSVEISPSVSPAETAEISPPKDTGIDKLQLDIESTIIELSSIGPEYFGAGPQDAEAWKESMRRTIDHLADLRQRAATRWGEGAQTGKLDQHIAFYEDLYAQRPLISEAKQESEAQKDTPQTQGLEDYIEALVMSELLEDDQIGPFMDNLRRPEAIPGLLERQLEILNQYKVHPVNSDNHQIAEGWDSIRRALHGEDNYLTASNGVVTLFGSMIYGDPNKLDYDLSSLVYTKMRPERQRKLEGHIKRCNKQVANQWPFGQGEQIHFVHIPTLYSQSRQASKLELPADKIEEFAVDATFAASLLNGIPLIHTSKRDMPTLQNELKRQVSQNPLLGSIILENFRKTESIRKRRRGK